MSTVAVLGGGAGGCAATVDLGLAGHRVQLWNRRAVTIEPLLAGGALSYTGVLGVGETTPALVTSDLPTALRDADVVVICQPALAHEGMLSDLAKLGCRLPLVLNPGHTGGALHARAVFAAHSTPLPPVAELSTLTYVARKPAPDQVAIYGKAGRVHVAALPGGEIARDLAVDLFPAAAVAPDVLATSLANVNLVLHPPGAILSAAWVEAMPGAFTFYVQAMTDGVARVVANLDAERLQVARAFGHDLDPLLVEMTAIGTVDGDSGSEPDLGQAIRSARANSQIKAPDSLSHRYYREDFPYGVVPFLALAQIAETPVPVAESLLVLSELITSEPFRETGLTASRLGLTGVTAQQLRDIVGR